MSKRQPLPTNIKKRILERDDHKCCKCGRCESLQIHHVLAVMDGGRDDDDNLKTLCTPCHKEWHIVESVSYIDFDQWIEYPPAHRLVSAMHHMASSQDATLVTAAEFIQGVKIGGRDFALIETTEPMRE